MKKEKTIYGMTYAAVIAAIYVTLTMVFAPVSYGAIQFRISEALCVLPYFTPAAVPGLFIGCFLANILGGAPLPDIIFGSLATLIGAIGSYAVRNCKQLVCLPPIVANTIVIPWVLRYTYGVEIMIPYLMLTIGVGEILAIGVIGNIFLYILEKYGKFLFTSKLQ